MDEYAELIERFLKRQEGFIRKHLYHNDSHNIEEIEILFLEKAFGFKNLLGKPEDIQKGSIPINLENAIYTYEENKQSNNFLLTVLENLIKDYNKSKIKKEKPIDIDVNKNIKKKTLEEILEMLTPKDRLNLQFQKLILMKNNEDYLELALLYLNDILGVSTGEVYSLFGFKNRMQHWRKLDSARETAFSIINDYLPDIDLEEITRKTQAKQRLITYINKNQREIKSKAFKKSVKEQEKIKKDNLNNIWEDIEYMINDIFQESDSFRVKNLKWYIKENYYDFDKVLETLYHLHVFRRDFEEMLEFLREYKYEGEENE